MLTELLGAKHNLGGRAGKRRLRRLELLLLGSVLIGGVVTVNIGDSVEDLVVVDAALDLEAHLPVDFLLVLGAFLTGGGGADIVAVVTLEDIADSRELLLIHSDVDDRR